MTAIALPSVILPERRKIVVPRLSIREKRPQWVTGEPLAPDAPPVYVGDFGKHVADIVLWMAGGLSSATAQAMLNELYGGTAFTADANIFFGLWTTALTVTSTGSTGTETTYGSYARVSQTNNTTNYPATSGSAPASGSNATAVTFATSTSGSATIISGASLSASSAGTIRAWGDIASTIINSGDTPKINIGGHVYSLAAS